MPTTIDRVFAALLSPDVLLRIIPGCERLIQLGPATSTGNLTFEARIQGENGSPATLTLKTAGLRQPEHLQLEIAGYAAGGPISGQALIDLVDLVEQGNHTLVAYVLTLATPGINPADCQEAISKFCGHLADHLYSERMEREIVGSSSEAEIAHGEPPAKSAQILYQGPHGQIVALPGRWSLGKLRPDSIRMWRQRARWMGTGMLIGISVFSIAAILVRWLGDHEN